MTAQTEPRVNCASCAVCGDGLDRVYALVTPVILGPTPWPKSKRRKGPQSPQMGRQILIAERAKALRISPEGAAVCDPCLPLLRLPNDGTFCVTHHDADLEEPSTYRRLARQVLKAASTDARGNATVADPERSARAMTYLFDPRLARSRDFWFHLAGLTTDSREKKSKLAARYLATLAEAPQKAQVSA